MDKDMIEKFKHDLEYTTSNCSNMHERLLLESCDGDQSGQPDGNTDINSKIESIRKEYNNVVGSMEYRSRYDFFVTCQKDNFKFHSFDWQEQMFYSISRFITSVGAGLLITLPFIYYLVVYVYYS